MKPSPKKRRPGRPSDYTPAKGALLCEQIAAGKTLRELKVPTSTVMRWVNEHPEFREQYTRARELQADAWFDEAIDKARKATREDAHAVRVLIDTLKWAAGKRAPKRYGDRSVVEHTGGEGDPIKLELRRKVEELDDDAIDHEIAELEAAAAKTAKPSA